MIKKEVVTLNKKQLDFLIRCIARAMSVTHRHPLYISYEIELYIQDILKELEDVE